jgi:ubiquinone/menaquinone biosynthesis C-methylase UbiE
MMSDPPWYRQFFGEDYLRIYCHRLTPERTAQEVEGIVSLLALPPGSRILDLCCGHGRHAIPLAQRGYQVTGQDLSEFFLQCAREEAGAQGVEVEWVHRDMRQIPFDNEFDAVMNIFTAFGYFETEAEDQKVLHQVRKALKPGGRFLIEIVHRESVLRRFTPHGIDRLDSGLLVLEERHFDLLTSRITVSVTLLEPDGRRTQYQHSERVYSLTEMARMLATAGLEIQACYGGLDGRPLALDTHRLVVVSRK